MENRMIGDMLKRIEDSGIFLAGPGGIDERVIMVLVERKEKDKPLSKQTDKCKEYMNFIRHIIAS